MFRHTAYSGLNPMSVPSLSQASPTKYLPPPICAFVPPFGDRSEPLTRCPCCNSSRARPLIPQPPIPTKCTRRGRPPRKSISCCLLAILLQESGQTFCGIIHGQQACRAGHADALGFIVKQLGNGLGQSLPAFRMQAAEL